MNEGGVLMASRLVSGIATANDHTHDLIESWSIEDTSDGHLVRIAVRDVHGKMVRTRFDLFYSPRRASELAVSKK